ncbi:M20/M25/M40 family metallo-hydrolase [Lysobacter solisilvae (ex Woo and Kim 2022)]|uniref:M20/M25/M40 family metallo-hydrolase n=1 Tax=Agrilutibacter terrestris TaxID=2865112 RepID=A0A7H0G069_9GAMM|nr:M20/M25/M40 family metallo-hydrolase [Lysobacter terrestris]QNP41685.1 M20/M25/M40 family metallo-hydrolase [Lysobacter terrestris]
MRIAILAAALFAAANATAADNPWHAKARGLLKEAVAIPTVAGRGKVPELAQHLAAQYKAAGWADGDVRVMPYDATPENKTAALIVRWPAAGATSAKPILLLAHMDVVEAHAEDWSMDPFTMVEKDGYFYGRGTSDDKMGVVAVTTALLQLKAQGFKPRRDIVVLFTGDEETTGRGAVLGATEWRPLLDAEYGLNADGGGGGFSADKRPIGFTFQTAEKTYADYTFTTHNAGGHSSKPRPDNAIYELSAALNRLGAYRFEPALNATTRAYFSERQKGEQGALGDAMRAWLKNPADGAAADAIEADAGEVGLTRTRCVATMLAGGHAPNALPQTAKATVNCRILPGVSPDAIRDELQRIAGGKVEVARLDAYKTSLDSPLRDDVLQAYAKSVHTRFPGAPVIPEMSTGASDARPFRENGIPIYGVDGSWGIVPDDVRAHGRDERLPVKALDDDVDHWVRMLKSLAG